MRSTGVAQFPRAPEAPGRADRNDPASECGCDIVVPIADHTRLAVRDGAPAPSERFDRAPQRFRFRFTVAFGRRPHDDCKGVTYPERAQNRFGKTQRFRSRDGERRIPADRGKHLDDSRLQERAAARGDRFVEFPVTQHASRNVASVAAALRDQFRKTIAQRRPDDALDALRRKRSVTEFDERLIDAADDPRAGIDEYAVEIEVDAARRRRNAK